VFVVLGTQHAMNMRQVFIRGPAGFTICVPLYFTNGTIFEKQFLNIKCIFLLSITVMSSGPGSSVGIATDYGLEGPGIEKKNPDGGEIFCISPDRP
jgi:hypothetical protein